MALEKSTRNKIHNYCIKDLPGDLIWHIKKFDFIDDMELKNRLGRAFYSARYMSKLMEAIFVDGDELHGFVKFQIIQYAAIYEAVITYLLWNKFSDHEEVIKIQTHKSYKPISAFAKNTKLIYESEEIYTCAYKDSKTPRNSISFSDKVDCGVRIGIIDEKYSEEIKGFYKLRNLAHIEAEAKHQIDVELEQSRMCYWRMQPFLEKISEFFKD